MSEPTNQSVQIQGWIDRLRAGDESAREHLLSCACTRLIALTRKMLRSFQRVRRWEETDDVFQNASVRLYRALGDVRPADAVAFFRLAAVAVRRELLDLAKHYYGPRGVGANHASIGGEEALPEPPAPGDGPEQLAAWSRFHELVERLPDEERAVFDLLWYQELQQAEAAALLGISERTVKRLWQSARLALHDGLGGVLPGL